MDYGLEYTSYVCSFTSHTNFDNRTPYEVLKEETLDILEYLYFDFYQWVKYYEPTSFPAGCEKLGHWLGPTHHVGQAMCNWILKESRQVITQSLVQALITMLRLIFPLHLILY